MERQQPICILFNLSQISPQSPCEHVDCVGYCVGVLERHTLLIVLKKLLKLPRSSKVFRGHAGKVHISSTSCQPSAGG